MCERDYYNFELLRVLVVEIGYAWAAWAVRGVIRTAVSAITGADLLSQYLSFDEVLRDESN